MFNCLIEGKAIFGVFFEDVGSPGANFQDHGRDEVE